MASKTKHMARARPFEWYLNTLKEVSNYINTKNVFSSGQWFLKKSCSFISFKTLENIEVEWLQILRKTLIIYSMLERFSIFLFAR